MKKKVKKQQKDLIIMGKKKKPAHRKMTKKDIETHEKKGKFWNTKEVGRVKQVIIRNNKPYFVEGLIREENIKKTIKSRKNVAKEQLSIITVPKKAKKGNQKWRALYVSNPDYIKGYEPKK